MKWLKRTLLVVLALLFSGCAALDGYERRYGIAYWGEDGRKVEASVTIIPLDDK